MSTTSLSSVIDLYAIPTGRRLFALNQVLTKAKAAKHTVLVQHCQSAITQDRECLSLERKWAGGTPNAAGKRVVSAPPEDAPDRMVIDPLVDRTLVAIRDHAESQTAGTLPDDPIQGRVRAFLKRIFPSGVADVVSLPHVEELAAVENIVTDLTTPELAGTVEYLGLERLVQRLAHLTVQYRAALQATPETIGFDEIRTIRNQGQERLLQAVALIIGKYYDASPEHIATRTDLLGPILVQDAAVGAALRHRRAVPDVNPDTGTPEPTEAPTEPVIEPVVPPA